MRTTTYVHEVRAILEARALVLNNDRGPEPKEEILLVLRILQHSCLTTQRGEVLYIMESAMRTLRAYIRFGSDTSLSSHGARIIAAL